MSITPIEREQRGEQVQDEKCLHRIYQQRIHLQNYFNALAGTLISPRSSVLPGRDLELARPLRRSLRL